MADQIAKFFQFASDTVIAPSIFAGELEYQLDDLGFDRRASDLLRRLVEGLLTFDKLAMPTEECIGF